MCLKLMKPNITSPDVYGSEFLILTLFADPIKTSLLVIQLKNKITYSDVSHTDGYLFRINNVFQGDKNIF